MIEKIDRRCRSALAPFDPRAEVRTHEIHAPHLSRRKGLARSHPAAAARGDESCAPLIRKLVDQKKLLAGAPLHPTSTATTIRYREGKRLLTDGPFAETREQLGGYTIIEANNLDEAIAVASGIVGTSTLATIEVRPIVEHEGVPSVPQKY
jgi:hypothetical protein